LLRRSSPESGTPSTVSLCRIGAITGREQSQQGSPLFDHLVGAGEERRPSLQDYRIVTVQIDPFEVMVSAKQMPTEHFADYTFVFN
jgi:hypothetical protein